MTRPLALLCYEKLLPGSQLVTRLEDLGYRVQAVLDAASLAEVAEAQSPMVLVVDLSSAKNDVCQRIKAIKENPATGHLPVLAFCPAANTNLQSAAVAAGAKLVAGEEAILGHLPQLLQRVLEMD